MGIVPALTLGAAAVRPAADAAPAVVAAGTPAGMAADLRRLVAPERVLTRPIDLIRFASDASLYRLIPQAVVLAADAGEVAALLRYGRTAGIPITFRSAGTSLSGQSQSSGILVEVRRFFDGFTVLDGGLRVRARPGTIAARVNTALARFDRKLGPDPASINAATIGGIVANNSSGMCCGVTDNSYRTLESLTFVLASGTRIDTAAADAEQAFAEAEPELAAGLLRLRQHLRADTDLAAQVRRKHQVKNTTGYGLNALLDHDTPLSIFAHLLVGSEGTLGFIAEVVLRTVPARSHRATALPLFDSLDAACAAVGVFRYAGAQAVELLDRASLQAVADRPGVPAGLAALPPGAAALLVEVRASDATELGADLAAVESAATGLTGLLASAPVTFTRDAKAQRRLWAVREGLFTSVGAARPSGSSVVLEDVTFPPARLADGVRDLSALLRDHGYTDAVVFGHAKDGNLHFLVTPRFDEPAEVDRYAGFMAAMAELVAVRYGGSLKGEHGTGRNIAPFVPTEWGAPAVALMREIKRLADPDGVLNPGVILTDDPRAHLTHLKGAPSIEPEADRCIECGYCERVCPSRDLTTTPRQRIVVRRELARQASLAGGAGTPVGDALRRDFDYDVRDTCAGDGLCEIACPVDIDTGALVKRFRHDDHPRSERRLAAAAARHWAAAESVTRSALRLGLMAADRTSDERVAGLTAMLRRLTRGLLVPQWLDATPPPAPPLPRSTRRDEARAVYLPACVNRMFGPDPGAGLPTPDALVTLASRAGATEWIPPDVAGVCCGTPWVSKGYPEGAAVMARRTVAAAWRWTDGGRLPVVTDASSCALGLRELPAHLDGADRDRGDQLRFVDSIDYVHDELLPGLRGRLDRSTRPHRPNRSSVAVHATCSVQHAQNTEALLAIAHALADEVVTPAAGSCCGFAGDRGFWRPELTESATAPLARELAEHEAA
jgi:D-lactate dehydrogenase